MDTSQAGVREEQSTAGIVGMLLLAGYLVITDSARELHFLATAAAALYLLRSNRDLLKPVLLIVLPILLFAALGLVHSAILLQFSFDTLKGLWYSLRMPVYITFGILLARTLKNDITMFGAIAVASTILALSFLYGYLTEPALANSSRDVIRSVVGGGSILNGMTVGIAAVIAFRHQTSPQTIAFFAVAAAVALLTIFWADSRSVLIVALVMLAYAFRGIPIRRFVVPVILFILVAQFILTTPVLLSFVPEQALQTFTKSAPRAISEVMPFDRVSMSDINTQWRGYETFLTFARIYDGGLGAIIFGTGMHTSVALPIPMDLGGTYLDSIPIFHNGFSFSIFRCGLIGLGLLVWQYVKLAQNIERGLSNRWNELDVLAALGCGLLVAMTIAFAVTTGLLNYGEIGATSCVFIGYVIGRLRDAAARRAGRREGQLKGQSEGRA